MGIGEQYELEQTGRITSENKREFIKSIESAEVAALKQRICFLEEDNRRLARLTIDLAALAKGA